MRTYLVSHKGSDIKRYAGTQADARAARAELMEEHDVPKKDVTIVEEEVPTTKDGLIAYLNKLVG